MNEYDELRKVLTGKAVEIATALNLPIQMPNGPTITEPAGPWLDFAYLIGDTGQAECGGPAALEITVGTLDFEVLVPERTGDGPAIAYANQIKKLINRKQYLVGNYGYVTLRAVSVHQLPRTMNGWFRACASTSFWFHHRDPDADPLQNF
jgi:hypothetical protein